MNSQAKTENEPSTPTAEEVRRIVDTYVGPLQRGTFDRWLAQHDAEMLAAARPSWEAESREALAGQLCRIRTGHVLLSFEPLSEDYVAADALLASGVVTLATPAETDEVAAEVAQQGLPEGTTLAALIEHHRAQAATAAAFDALAPVVSQGDTPADEASECAGFDWGEWEGIDGPVLLCGVHGYPAQGEVYDRLPSQVGATCQAVDQPSAVPVDALGFPTEVGATFRAKLAGDGVPFPAMPLRVVSAGVFERPDLGAKVRLLTHDLDPASIEDVRRAGERSVR